MHRAASSPRHNLEMFQPTSANPNAYACKVRVALAEKGLPFELLLEVPWNGMTATPKYNPLQTLPVRILEDGRAAYERGAL